MDSEDLQCIICTAKPTFSDISHLLTHVASKAHLSFYFKLQVRSHQEEEATQLLEEYDAWYNDNGLAVLLSERMRTKEGRKMKKAPRQASKAPVAGNPRPQRKSGRSTTKASNSASDTYFPDLLDPRLAGPSDNIKPDAEEDSSFYLTSYPPATPLANTHPTLRIECVPSGLTQPMYMGNSTDWHGEHPYEPRHNAHTSMNALQTPLRTRRHAASDPIPLAESQSQDVFHEDEQNEVADEKTRAEEISRLKGIFWPGMDIFDSATHQMRRKRNQKKDANVLKLLEKTSSLVEPTELIFSPAGTLRKERVISGNVEDDSPLKGETPVPKKRISRPKREVLRQVDPNIPLAQDRKGSKKVVTQNLNGKVQQIVVDTTGSPRRLNDMADFGPPKHTIDDEFDISMQELGKRPRQAFTIFSDEVLNPSVTREVLTLTPTRLVLDRKPDLSHTHGMKANRDKENIEPILNSQGRVGLNNWQSPFFNRSDIGNVGFIPGYFYNEPLGNGLGDDGKSGYRPNPLLAAPKMSFYEGNPYDDDFTVSGAWTTISREVSTEATISEAEHRDLARMYLA
ncbi:hypothetical protein N7495_002799 [Penicillium taxi]|uniref:uncharacterized protein n=1 Tax=Penicillium taxi TaxID=168475 RepID=UPI0025458413|nr:uncharacterized protein N7495_002799 [Penicillium taxi]KAJ5902271.1 hypothetical protein N7495_002799 [Penicillium taxi]